jgi:hypothetical protein
MRVHMLRCARPSLGFSRRVTVARYFHRVTAEFLNYDAQGKPVSTKVPAIIGNPGETYVLIYPEIGRALRAGSPRYASASGVEERCKLTFFHDSQHFGFGTISSLAHQTSFN